VDGGFLAHEQIEAVDDKTELHAPVASKDGGLMI
jgi:hypothetical protein